MEIRSAALYPLSGLAELFTAGFAGYVIPVKLSAEALRLDEVDAAEFSRQLALITPPAALPWQLEPATLSSPPRSARCFSLNGKSFVYVASVTETVVSIRGVLTVPPERRKGHGRR